MVDKDLVTELARYASAEVNETLGLNLWHDQTRGNRCDLLTLYVLQALARRGITDVCREFHKDQETSDWHYLLAYKLPEEAPSSGDMITDLNPWRGCESSSATGILHATREEVMWRIKSADVPPSQVRLRSTDTILKLHHPASTLPLVSYPGND